MKRKLLIMSLSGLSFLMSNKLSAQAPVADFSISQPTTCVGSVIQINDLSSDTPTSWSYTVESMTGTLTVQNPTLVFNVAGDFDITLLATNGSGTSMPVTKNVIVNALPVITVAQPVSTVCAGSQVTLSASGAATYTWSNGTSNTDTFVPTATAAYTVTGTDANSCTNTAIQSVTVNPLPVLSIAGNTAVCAGSAITQTVSGANTYSWSTGATADNISETPAINTTYTVTGTLAATGCSNTATKLIVVNALPTITVNDGTVCAGSIFTINASGANTYTYSSTNNTVIPVANASYTVGGTSLEGCASATTAISSVTVNALPVVSVNSGTVCAGNSFTITPTGALTYTFLNSTNATVTPASTTAYSVTGADANGCVTAASAVATVVVNALPVVTVNSGSICAGSVFTMNPAGAATFTFVNGSNTVSPTANATYSVHGTDAFGCVSSGYAVSTVSVYARPVITANSGTICAGETFTITAGGASTYTYSGGSSTVTPTATTDYTVTGTSVNGCASIAPAISSVTVFANPVLTVSGIGVICNGSTTTLTASGANTIVWLIGAGVLTNSVAVNPTSTTEYTVGGISNGCVDIAFVTVTVNPVPSVVATAAASVVCTGVTTSLTGTGATTYSWNTGQTTANIVITPTANVTYTVTGTTNGCSKAVTVTQTIDACLGVAKLTNSFETAVYPNPTKGSFTVKVTQATSVKIINVIGQTIYASELTEGENMVSLNGQAEGIYFVQLKQGSQVKTVRVVKN